MMLFMGFFSGFWFGFVFAICSTTFQWLLDSGIPDDNAAIYVKVVSDLFKSTIS